MTCPSCKHPHSLVVDKRSGRRRRECRQCKVRWNTAEILAPGTIAPAKRLGKPKPTGPTRSWLERIEEKLNS